MLNTNLLRPVHTLAVPEVYRALATGAYGLNEQEVQSRLARFGCNSISQLPGKPLVVRFLANFTHLMAILLWAGGIVGFLAQMPQLGVAIWLVNLINGVFSFWQEYKAEKATEALQKLLPARVHVLRGGHVEYIPADQLVPGDVILLEEGGKISADARIVLSTELQVDQSTLTGESNPVPKSNQPVLHSNLTTAELGNIVFAGTSVTSGSGKAVVFATGMNTEFGKIAHLTQSVGDEPSPLQKEMSRVTKLVTMLALGIGVVFFVLATIFTKVGLAQSFIFAMGMIVAFVPEGMLPTVTLALAMGVQRMARRNALVKRLSAVETLGCTSIICTDKTGTLTKNEMTVREIWAGNCKFEVSGAGYAPSGIIIARSIQTDMLGASDGTLKELLVASALCNNAHVVSPNHEHPNWTILGDPTEAAMRVVARKGGLDLDKELSLAPRLAELPFDSRRKRMSTIHVSCGVRVAYVKGAPKEVLMLCSRISLAGKGGPLSEEQKIQVLAANDEYARAGLRVLAVAIRILPDDLKTYTPETVEHDLTFLGLVAMLDPPHPEVAEAVTKCHEAGIRIVMVTGDYGLTAESIARRVGIIRTQQARIITGTELDGMDDNELKAVLHDELIFARAAPEHKLRVVSAYQRLGLVVAVTGDGANDAPSLKKADIGVAMGIAGTDVAKEAADMILLDDNFASIVNAVEEGRTVYANIRRFATYVFNSNMAEAVPFIAMLFSQGRIPLPLTVMQVLTIDLGTDMVPAIALGAEPPESGIMRQPPRALKEPLLNSVVLMKALAWYGLIEALAAMSCYFFVNWQNGWPAIPLASEGTAGYHIATTMTLCGIVAAQIGAVFCCRSDRGSILKLGFFSNKLVLVGIGFELSLLMLLIYVPFLQSIFNTGPLNVSQLMFVFLWTPIILVLDELRKAFLRGAEHQSTRN